MHLWDARPHSGQQRQEMLLRLHCTGSVLASQLAHGPEHKSAMARGITGHMDPQASHDPWLCTSSSTAACQHA
eukprot:12412205-Karenia_brevis.AAC.1